MYDMSTMLKLCSGILGRQLRTFFEIIAQWTFEWLTDSHNFWRDLWVLNCGFVPSAQFLCHQPMQVLTHLQNVNFWCKD